MSYDYLRLSKSNHNYVREKHLSVIRRFIHIAVFSFTRWNHFSLLKNDIGDTLWLSTQIMALCVLYKDELQAAIQLLILANTTEGIDYIESKNKAILLNLNIYIARCCYNAVIF